MAFSQFPLLPPELWDAPEPGKEKKELSRYDKIRKTLVYPAVPLDFENIANEYADTSKKKSYNLKLIHKEGKDQHDVNCQLTPKGVEFVCRCGKYPLYYMKHTGKYPAFNVTFSDKVLKDEDLEVNILKEVDNGVSIFTTLVRLKDEEQKDYWFKYVQEVRKNFR